MDKKAAALFSAAFLAAAAMPAAAIAMPSICVKPDPDVAARFDGVGCYDNVVMLIQKNGLYGYAELDGKIIIPPQYQDAADKPAERFPRNRELLIPVKKASDGATSICRAKPASHSAMRRPSRLSNNTARPPECGKTAVIFQSTSKAAKSNSKADKPKRKQSRIFSGSVCLSRHGRTQSILT